jgi:hypothetical protein
MKESEKANELIRKHFEWTEDKEFSYAENLRFAKQCALITVDEILNMPFLEYSRYKNTFDDYFNDCTKSKYYWEEVKKEIEKL